MVRRPERFFLLAALAAILALAWFKPLEIAATDQVDAGLKRALVSFGTARALNGVISVAQGFQIAAEPGGVGVILAPGQILRPINDVVGQFAEMMLAASVVFGVMKVLISIGSHWSVSLLLSAAAVAWVWLRWRGRDSQIWVARILFVLLLIRFAMPLVTVGSDAVFLAFMQDEYASSQNAIEGNVGAAETLGPSAEDAKPGGGLLDRLRDWLAQKADVVARLDQLKQLASQLIEHMIKLIVVFLMQTLLIPLLLFWILYRAGKSMFDAPLRPGVRARREDSR